jgi:hypothetical protein
MDTKSTQCNSNELNRDELLNKISEQYDKFLGLYTLKNTLSYFSRVKYIKVEDENGNENEIAAKNGAELKEYITTIINDKQKLENFANSVYTQIASPYDSGKSINTRYATGNDKKYIEANLIVTFITRLSNACHEPSTHSSAVAPVVDGGKRKSKKSKRGGKSKKYGKSKKSRRTARKY